MPGIWAGALDPGFCSFSIHDRLVVTEAGYKRAVPAPSPNSASEYNWNQLLFRDRQGVGCRIPLNLEPRGAVPCSTTPWSRCHRHVDGRKCRSIGVGIRPTRLGRHGRLMTIVWMLIWGLRAWWWWGGRSFVEERTFPVWPLCRRISISSPIKDCNWFLVHEQRSFQPDRLWQRMMHTVTIFFRQLPSKLIYSSYAVWISLFPTDQSTSQGHSKGSFQR